MSRRLDAIKAIVASYVSSQGLFALSWLECVKVKITVEEERWQRINCGD
jgi:hypothetical protein